MRESLIDGWRLGGAALHFILEHRPVRRYMLIATALLALFWAGAAVAGVLLRRHAGPLEYVLVGLGALYVLSLMVTAAAVGLAGLIAETLDDRPAGVGTGWRVVRERRGSIARWAVVDCLVGLPSRAVGSWSVDQLVSLLLGFGWGLLTFFALPTIAVTGANARDTARHSLRLVRSQWGEAVYSTVYLWLRAVVVFGVPAVASVAAGVLLIRASREFLGIVFFAAGAAGLALTYLLAQGARSVVTVVLYRFASEGVVYPAFPEELLHRSVRGPSAVINRIARRIEGDRLRRLRRRVLGELER
jgi:hypothetical protein